MPRKRCWLGHDWGEWTNYWENIVGEVRRKRSCVTCQQEHDEHVGFGRPTWVGTGEAPNAPPPNQNSIGCDED